MRKNFAFSHNIYEGKTMKKSFAILTLILVAVCGVLFGCDKDRYANLKIELSSPNLIGDTLTLYYGQETDLSATVTGVKGINKSVYFTCSDPEALEFTNTQNTSTGTKTVVKANKPTYDNLFLLQAKSVETNSKFAEVKVKVILPIEGMDFGESQGKTQNLAVSTAIPLNLYNHIVFYPQKPYVTNQKNVVYSILNYGLNNPNDISIDENGIISVSDNIVDNLVTDTECLTIRVTSTDNVSIYADIKINVIRDIDASTVQLDSSQISFNGEYADKTNMVLFSNSESFYSEILSVTVQTGQELTISPILSGDSNVIEVTHLPAEDESTSINGQITSRTQKFRIRAKSIQGITYINFKIKIKNINNDMEYLLSDDAMITVEVSGLPKSIDLKQDGTSYSNNSTLIIYDTYQTTSTTMSYGSKIVLNVSSDSNSAVDELNKYLKVEFLDGDKDVSSYFELSNINGLPIELDNGSFKILSNNTFYIKATSKSIGKTFVMRVTTVIDKFIVYANGSSSSVQTELVTNEYFVASNYGVNEINTDQREYVLKLYTGLSSQNADKTQMLISYNENADLSNILVNYNDAYIQVEQINSNTLLLTGIKLGETNLEIVANNGFSKLVRVKIVNEVTNVDISVDSPISSQVITQVSNDIDGKLSKVSAKAGGKFSIYNIVTPHVSGIISYEYSSNDTTIATVNSSGVVVTRASGVTTINVVANYYKFEVNEQGFLSVVEDTFENSFELTVFIPTTRISLNRTVVDVYSNDSLGFDYKGQSLVEVYPIISPVTASIYDDETAVTYTLLGNNNNLVEISRGTYQAYLGANEDSATVIIVVTINEYGTSTTLTCTVNIKRAKQIKNISIDSVEKVDGVYALNMRQDEIHQLQVSYDPTDAYITDLKFVLIDAETGDTYLDSSDIVTVDEVNKTITSSSVNSGEIYLRIYAKDSMINAYEGTVYVDIYIRVTDGSIDNPYVINNVSELKRIADAPSKHYVLGNDIDLAGETIQPLDVLTGTLNGYYYIKGIDGAEDVIKFNSILNVVIDAGDNENVGLFSEIGTTGALLNLHLTISRLVVSNNSKVQNIGTFAGINNGLIMNCSVVVEDYIVESYDNTILGDNVSINVGGMVGTNNGYIYNFATTLGEGVEGGLKLASKNLDDEFTPTFNTLISRYSDGTIVNEEVSINNDLDMDEYLQNYIPYSNFVDGIIVVRDTIFQSINVGGIAGKNTSVINGIYGIYSYIDERSFSGSTEQEFVFTATIQNQGIDASLTITPNGADTRNANSTYGGIVGYNETVATNTDENYLGACVYNVSSSGSISGQNNIGGIVGYAIGTNIKHSVVKNALSSMKLNGSEKVGGIQGYGRQSQLNLVRVENYQDISGNNNTLIDARNRVGGVAGEITNSTISYAYAVSFVNANNNYEITTINNDFNVYVGGLVGYSSNTAISYSYSKLKLDITATSGSSVGGLVGFFDGTSSLTESFFGGNISFKSNSQDKSKCGSLIGQVVSSDAVMSNCFVFENVSIANFVGQFPENWFNATTRTDITKNKNTAVSNMSNRPHWAVPNDSSDFGLLNDGYPVITYGLVNPPQDTPFVKLVPTSMTISKKANMPADIDATFIGRNVIIKYSANNSEYNEYNINEMFAISVQPAQIKTVSLLVTSSDPNVVNITNDGKLIATGIGSATITFITRLNTNLRYTFTVFVIQKVTSMKIFTNSNLAGDVLVDTLDLGTVNSVSVRKDATQKLFPVYYCDDVVVYPDFDIIYDVDDDSLIEIVNGEIKAKQETTNANVTLRVVENLTGIAQEIIIFGGDARNPISFNVEVYSGATDINIKPNNKVQLTKYVPQQINFELITDSTTDKVIVEIIDQDGNTFYPVLTMLDADSTDYLIYYKDKNGNVIQDQDTVNQLLKELMLNDITMCFALSEVSNYSGSLAVSVRSGFEYVTQSTTYTLRFSAVSNPDVTKSIQIEFVPQTLLHMDANYYPFESLDEITQDFVFSEEPTTAIIPGRFGLFKINTLPVYSGIEQFSIRANNADGHVNFSQLVKNKSIDQDKQPYRFAPNILVQDDSGTIKLLRLSNYLGTYVTTGTQISSQSIIYENQKDANGNIIAQYVLVKVQDTVENGIYETTYERYEFDGNIYVQIVSGSDLYSIKNFTIDVLANYGDGTSNIYTHYFEVQDLPNIDIKSSRDYISVEKGDFVTISASLSNGQEGEISLSVDENMRDLVNFTDSHILTLKDREDIKEYLGEDITIYATYTINVDGRIETITSEKKIKIVDIVLEDIEIDGANKDGFLTFTVSSTIQLKANIIGVGSAQDINNKSMQISRQMIEKVGASGVSSQIVAYWKYIRANGNMTNIDDTSLNLPFSITKSFVAQNQAILSLVGSTNAGTVSMSLSLYYYYSEDGILSFTDDPNVASGSVVAFNKTFTIQVVVDSNADRPIPIYTQEDLYAMTDGGNYILMADITIESHTPIKALISSLDGNNKIITIKNFAYDDNTSGSVTNSINLGLFDTIGEGAVIKNVIVAYTNDKTTPLNLTNYTTINIGGIAAINNGIITNSEVISVYDKDEYDALNSTDNVYSLISYTFNINTSVQIDGTLVTTKFGGLVAQNTTTGRITNSRVGRESVTIVTPKDNNGTTYSEDTYKYTAPITIIKVEGSGNIGGFVGDNSGVISSCYFKNGQIEIVTFSSSYTKVAGFASTNNGAIYGSYSAGWEEEDFITGGNNYLLKGDISSGGDMSITRQDINTSRRMGGGIFSNANIAGFIYENTGVIANSYSALNISGNPLFAANRNNITHSANLTEYGNLNAGGFVFNNGNNGQIETSYSISKLKSKITTHGAFVGVSPISGDVQNTGVVDKCYYLVETNETIYDDYDPAYPISQSLAIDDDIEINTNEFIEKESFSGFSFDNENYSTQMQSGAIWGMKIFSNIYAEDSNSQVGYPELIDANNVAISLRVLRVDDNDPNSYYYLYVQDFEKGSVNNPQIITSAIEYNNLFSDILSSTAAIENINVKYTGNIRLVTDIDFTNLPPTSSSFEYASVINSLSIFDGNNMFMYNIMLSDDSVENTAFGLFKSLNGVGIKNLSLTINNVSSTNGIAVGGLAGIIVDSDINNINIVAATEGASVSGKNFVGGLAGIIVAGDEETLHYINNIQSNVAVLASYTSEGGTSNLIKSGDIWSYIIPPAEIEGSTSTDYNLRLQYLPNNVSYAGGVAGVIDLLQAFKAEGEPDESNATLSISKVNARSINVGSLQIYSSISSYIELQNNVNIEAEYAGGIFGFIGTQTYFKEGGLTVYDANENHYINSTISAGGITAINYGFIDQVYVSHEEEKQITLDNNIQSLVNGTTNITWGNQTFYTGKPIYLGGIAGINVGCRYSNSGTIKNSYNRVDLRNSYATRIGGITGASHIGGLINVYTTASILGDLTTADSYYGQIIGQLLDNTNNNYYVETIINDLPDNTYYLEISNAVAINTWYTGDYEALKEYTNNFGIEYKKISNDSDTQSSTVKVKIGAIYAPYTSTDESERQNYDKYVKQFEGSGTYLFDKIYKGYNENTDKDYIDLFVGYDGGDDETQESKLYNYVSENYANNVITQNVYKDLFTVQTGVVSDAKNTIFSKTVWSERIWLFDDTRAVLTLKFGYIPNVALIYNAEQFLSILNEDPASSKTYIIMNDINFDEIQSGLINIGSNFRGTIRGIKVKDPNNSNIYRYPILFNLRLDVNGNDTALFTSTTNANFADINIVLKQFDDTYKLDEVTKRAVNTRSSVFIANGTNTTLTNINVYQKITEIPNHNYIKLNKGTTNDEAIYYDYRLEDNKYISGTETIDVTDAITITTHASYFGGLVANATNMTITNCKFSVPVESKYNPETIPNGANVYFGGLAGRYLGKIINSNVTKTLSVGVYGDNQTEITNNANVLASKVTDFYIGGAVGYLSGSLSTVSFGTERGNEIQLNVGEPNSEISSTNNVHIGGVAGSSQVLISTTSNETSTLTSISTYNTKINAYVYGSVNLGGVVGINEMTVDKLTYKNISSGLQAQSAPGSQKDDADIKVYTSSNRTLKSINVGGIIGKNTYSTINDLTTNISIYILDSNLTTISSSSISVGGIIGKSNNLTLANAIQDGNSIVVESSSRNYTIGGLIGSIETTVVAGASSGTTIINFAVSTLDFTVLGSGNVVTIGGTVGTASDLDVSNSLVYSKVYVAKGNLYPTIGGVAGLINRYKGETTNNEGSTIVMTIYYDSVADVTAQGNSVTELSIGQLFGKVTNFDENASLSMSSLYYNGTLFGMYTNEYYGQQNLGNVLTNVSNVDLETLSSKASLALAVPLSENRVNSYVIERLSSDYNFYTRLKHFLTKTNETSRDKIFVQNSGTILNPITITPATEYKEYSYYVANQDINISSPINLVEGVFIDFKGYTITINGANQQYVIQSIPQYAMISGLLIERANIQNASFSGIITPINSGYMIGCGVATYGETDSISGSNIGGMVWQNDGVILNCFSIARVEGTSGIAGGLVGQNYGQIAVSHTTGLIVSHGTTITGGLVGQNYGSISSSYTVGNMQYDDASYAYPFTKNMHDETYSGTINFNYYDINAYTGNNDSVAGVRAAKTVNLTDLASQETSSLVQTNGDWYDANYPNLVIRRSDKTNQITANMTNTWFNYGYSLVNLDEQITSKRGSSRLLDMLYTGNGKLEDGGTTNGFENSPYQITNAGIFEAFVLADHREKVKSYYIVMNNISFKAYDEWSEEWNNAGVYFRGDFNGNGYTLSDIDSKYGLFRAITGDAQAYDFTLTKAFSQTAMLAAYMTSSDGGNATLHDIIIDSTKNDKRLANANIETLDINSIKLSDDENSFNINHISCGVYVGYLERGTLQNLDLVGDTFTITSLIDEQHYVGSYVGEYYGGNIIHDNKADIFPNINKIELTGGTVGGYVGSLGGVSLENIVIPEKINILRGENIGGFCGKLYNCNLNNIQTNTTIKLIDVLKYGGIAAFTDINTNPDLTVISNSTANINYILDYDCRDYSGGILGIGSAVLIDNIVNSSEIISNEGVSGGIVGYLVNGQVISNKITEMVNSSRIYGKISAGGIVGMMDKGAIKTNSTQKRIVNNSIVESNVCAGGIVGKINSTGETLITCVKNSGSIKLDTISIQENSCAGGIVGRIVGSENQNCKTTISYVENDSINFESNVNIAKIGGIVGAAEYDFAISNATNNADIYVAGQYLGGIVGYAVYNGNETNISTVKNYGSIVLEPYYIQSVGGIVGYGKNILMSGATNGEDDTDKGVGLSVYVPGSNAGGIVGYLETSYIKSVSNKMQVFGAHNNGGIVGTILDSCIDTATNYADIATAPYLPYTTEYAGGIVGYLNGAYGGNTFVGSIVNNGNLDGNSKYAGGIAGYVENIGNYGMLSNNANIVGINKVGGIFGALKGVELAAKTSTSSLTNMGKLISGTDLSSSMVGGIIGFVEQSDIENAFSISIVNGTLELKGYYVGGIIGYSLNNVIQNIKTNAITINFYGIYIGGIVGFISGNSKTLSSLENNFTINAQSLTDNSSSYVGGIAGYGIRINFIDISNKANITFTQNQKNYLYLGGFVGYLNNSTINSSKQNAPNKQSADNITINVATSGTNYIYVGGAVGNAVSDTISNVVVEDITIDFYGDNFTLNDSIGGIAGRISNTEILYNLSATTTTVVTMTNKINGVIPDITKGNLPSVGGLAGMVSGYASKIENENTSKTIDVEIEIYGIHVGGLIGYIFDYCDISYITISKNSSINANTYAGGIVGWNNGNVEINNCKVYDLVNSKDSAGGIIGHVGGGTVIINNNENYADITGTKYAGGIVGSISGSAMVSITSNEMAGNVGSADYAGGILGYLNSTAPTVTISNNTITEENKSIGRYSSYAGGIIGYLTSTTKFRLNSNEVKNISLDATYSGGIIGQYSGALVDLFDKDMSNYYAITFNGFYGGFVIGNYISSSTVSRSITIQNIMESSIINSTYFGGYIGNCSGNISNLQLRIQFSGSNYTISKNVSFGGFIGYSSDANLSSIDIPSSIQSYLTGVDAHYIGGLVAYQHRGSISIIKNWGMYVYVYGKRVGGIVGHIYNATLDDIYNKSGQNTDRYTYVYNYDDDDTYTGGIVGYASESVINNCRNYDTVYASATNDTNNWVFAGGVIGRADNCEIRDCRNTGNVSSVVKIDNTIRSGVTVFGLTTFETTTTATAYAGGIVGYADDGSIYDCTSSGTIKGIYSKGRSKYNYYIASYNLNSWWGDWGVTYVQADISVKMYAANIAGYHNYDGVRSGNTGSENTINYEYVGNIGMGESSGCINSGWLTIGNSSYSGCCETAFNWVLNGGEGHKGWRNRSNAYN